MASSKFIVETTKLLQTYSGRDKVIRTVTYLSLMLSGISKSNENSKKFLTVSLQLSLCRTILRLFDDLPMLSYTLSYGLGRGVSSRAVYRTAPLRQLQCSELCCGCACCVNPLAGQAISWPDRLLIMSLIWCWLLL